jgi:hypothetical protein
VHNEKESIDIDDIKLDETLWYDSAYKFKHVRLSKNLLKSFDSSKYIDIFEMNDEVHNS